MIKNSLLVVVSIFLFLLLGCSSKLSVSFPDKDVEVPNIALTLESWYGRYPLWSLEDSLIIEVVPNDTANEVYTKQIQWMYINKRTPNYLEEITFSEARSVQAPIQIQATAFYPDSTFWQLNNKQITRVPVAPDDPAMALRSTLWQSIFLVPRYQEGMLLRIATHRRFHEPQFSDVAYMRTAYAARERVITLSWPKEYEINYTIHNGENIAIEIDSSDTSITMRSTNLTPIIQTKNSLSAHEWYASLHYSIPPTGKKSYSWAQTAQAYYAKLSDTLSLSSASDSLAQKISEESFDATLNSSFDTLQKHIRYLSMLDSVGAFIPRSTNEVIKSGFGDCKESSILLGQMLQAKGITTFPVLTSLRGNLQADSDIAGLRTFDHMALGVVSPEGDTLIVDPTNREATALTSSYPLYRRRYLPIGEDTSITLQSISPRDTFPNQIETRNRIVQGEKNKLRVNGDVSITGEAASRIFPVLSKARGDEREVVLFHILMELFELSLFSAKVTHLSYDSVGIYYEGDMSAHYVPLDGGGIELSVPSILGGHAAYAHVNYDGPTEMIGLKQVDTWILPANYRTVDLNKLADTTALGKWEITDSGIQRVFTRKESTIFTLDEMAAYLKKRNSLMNFTVWHE